MRAVRVCAIGLAAAGALAACSPDVTLVTSASSASASASSGTGAAGGGGGAEPACVARLSGAEERPSFATVLAASPASASVTAAVADVNAAGEVAFTGNLSGGELLVDGVPAGTCPDASASCAFFGLLAADGSLAWVHVYSGGLQGPLRFRGDVLETTGVELDLSAPFPPGSTAPSVSDDFFARFDHDGNLLSFVPFGTTGGLPLLDGQVPLADGGTLVGGYVLDALNSGPMDFAGCGASATVADELGFVARLDANGACTRLDFIGEAQTAIFSMGGDGSGDSITITGSFAGQLSLIGPDPLMAPPGFAAFIATGSTSPAGESWVSGAMLATVPAADWQSIDPAEVSRDGTTTVAPVGDASGVLSFWLADTHAAFSTSFGGPAAPASASVDAGVSPSELSADRPIVVAGSTADGTTTFEGASVTGSHFVALFDGAGKFCAARAMDGAVRSPFVEPSSVVFSENASGATTLRRLQLVDIAE